MRLTPRSLIWSMLLMLWLASPAYARVAVDASTSVSNEFGTSLRWTHTVGFESQRLLLVSVSLQYATSSGVTFNGQPLTLAGRQQGGAASNDGFVEIWSLVAPPAGTGAIVVSVPDGDAIVAGAASFYGVDQQQPLGTFASTQGQGTTPGIAVASAPGEIVFGALMWNHDWAPVTAEAGQTVLWNLAKQSPGFSDVTGAAGVAPGAATVTLSWSTQDDSWAVGAVPVRSAATVEYTLAEGATGFFTLDVLLANPNSEPAPVELTFFTPDGSTMSQPRTLAPLSRTTVTVNAIAGLESTEVSTRVTSLSGLPLVVERTMQWDASGYGSHTEKASQGAERTWFFAEGAQGFYRTYLLLANPQPVENAVHVQFLVEGGAPVTRDVTLPPTSRHTIDASLVPELDGQSFGMKVTFASPGVAERAMYFGDAPFLSGGHESAGSPGAATDWLFAEGATGSFFTTFLLFVNPNEGPAPADVTVTYLPASGSPVTKTKQLASGERLTVNIAGEDPALASTTVGARIASTLPILVERSQYWPFTPDRWLEAHNSVGVTRTATRWGLAEGRVGGESRYQTYILLANPGETSAEVDVTFLRTGAAPVTHRVTVPATSRVTVEAGPGTAVPELVDEEFGALIESTQPIAVERAMYSNAHGLTWAAGSNATATRLP